MSKKVKIIIELTFSDNIKQSEIDVIAANTLEGLVYQADSAGLAPAATNEAFTRKITVIAENGTKLTKDLLKD